MISLVFGPIRHQLCLFTCLVAFWVGLSVTANRQARRQQIRRQTDRQTVYIHLIYYFQQARDPPIHGFIYSLRRAVCSVLCRLCRSTETVDNHADVTVK